MGSRSPRYLASLTTPTITKLGGAAALDVLPNSLPSGSTSGKNRLTNASLTIAGDGFPRPNIAVSKPSSPDHPHAHRVEVFGRNAVDAAVQVIRGRHRLSRRRHRHLFPLPRIRGRADPATATTPGSSRTLAVRFTHNARVCAGVSPSVPGRS